MADGREVHLTTREQWHDWLVANHDSETSLWLVSWRTVTGRPHIRYEDVIEEALCFGWIDSTRRKLDEERVALYLSRRKKGGTWARSNKERVARLTEQGLMRPAGIAAVEQAKNDGPWTILDDVDDLVMPPDLAAALEARPGARDTYEGFTKSVKKQVLWWVVSAKRPATRVRRIEATTEAAAQGDSPLPK